MKGEGIQPRTPRQAWTEEKEVQEINISQSDEEVSVHQNLYKSELINHA